MANVSQAPDGMRGAQITSEQVVVDVSEHASAGRQVWNFLRGPYPTLLSRLVLGGIFVLSGLTKINAPLGFAASIRSYEIDIPNPIVDLMARGLPILELGLGVWLLVGLFTRFSAVVTAILMAIFTIAITQAWIRGVDADCGCFGGAGTASNPTFAEGLMKALGPVGDFLANEKIGPVVVIRDLVFLLMAVHLIFVPTILALDDLRKRSARATNEA